MSNPVLQKVFALACVCILAFGLYQCGRFFSDYIVDDYAIVYAGDIGRGIVLKRNGKLDLTIVDAWIDEYKVDAKNIYVARTPYVTYREHGGLGFKYLPVCEYWVIDRPTHEVKKVEFLSNVKCVK